MSQTDHSNTFFQLAEAYVNYTNRNIFLTGKAGTGKTTFLKHIVKNCAKPSVVVAPTGVAAINAGGVTMHSFFQLPFVPFVPDEALAGHAVSPRFLFQKIRFNENKRKLLQELELLIIDEISMVRADMLDAVDAILKHFRKKHKEPFGGVQVLMIGDLYQLPPVVVNEDHNVLSRLYKSPFFFNARVLQDSPPINIELQKVYRQKDEQFVNLLNNVRDNKVTDEDLQCLNSKFLPAFKPPEAEKYITLSSHNYIADEINEIELNKLPGRAHKFEAEVKGEFNENSYPTEWKLKLKEGAQIMFVKNDKGEHRRFYNGKIGIVKQINEDSITISFPDNDETLELELEEWQNIRYKYNEEKKKNEEHVIGTFKQYPIRLAWAITIHKSQGLTFERAIVDAGSSFTAGQVYVALSRLTTLEGLVLRSKIQRQNIYCDQDVLNFMSCHSDEKQLSKMLEGDQNEYIKKSLVNAFNFGKALSAIEEHIRRYQEKKSPHSEIAIHEATQWRKKLQEHNEVAGKFVKQQLSAILATEGADRYKQLHSRVSSAVEYFLRRLQDDIFKPLEKHREDLRQKAKVRKYMKSLRSIQIILSDTKNQLEQALWLANALCEGKNATEMLKQLDRKKAENSSIALQEETSPPKPQKGESQAISLEMFKSGMDIDDIAITRGLAPGTIEGHLTQFIKTGDLSVYNLVSEEKVNVILPLVAQSEDQKLSSVKEKLGDEYSYGDVRAVVNHWMYVKKTEKENEKK